MAQMQVRLEAVLFNDENKLLVARHERDSQSYWVLPGGKLELFESAPEALLRELREELGITDATVSELIYADEFIDKEKGRHIIKLGFGVEAPNSGNVTKVVVTDESIKEAKWFSFNELVESQNTFYPSKEFFTALFERLE